MNKREEKNTKHKWLIYYFLPDVEDVVVIAVVVIVVVVMLEIVAFVPIEEKKDFASRLNINKRFKAAI